jgi:hypothetical protein
LFYYPVCWSRFFRRLNSRNNEEDFVAEKVIEIHQGKLNFTNTQTGGMVTIKLPIPK